ncbi:hypothetical protein EX895_000669 [Sporisorium graminicola]|uniref:HCNGP-like protein n=1 Tax=Sporisorium graminicola TaxID=280036 RepID=A0A4U7L0D1_9BASI|nr:hypothetical protein EX895_000669 [Sporisorium graminicola]TKY90671.1 hypothetical protein EX895_000669 [Sporisorium graminicola]
MNESNGSSSSSLKLLPSRLHSPGNEASSAAGPDTIDRCTMEATAERSDASPSVLPHAKIRGTDILVTDFFGGAAMAEIHDAELFHDLPVVLPPPQRTSPATTPTSSDAEFRPFWGLAHHDRIFFTHDDASAGAPIPVNPRIQANLQRYHDLKHQGVHFNQTLMQNRSFNNPHVLSQLVDFLDIDETRSNLPCIDTGRSEGSWRAQFPFQAQTLVEGDPIAIEIGQKQKADAETRSRQTHADPHRKIAFDRARHDDEPQRPRKRRSSGGASKSRVA